MTVIRIVDPIPVRATVIRTPVVGPSPANVLAYLRCRASGADVHASIADIGVRITWETQFKTDFEISGYLPAQRDWYLQNTQVSATGMLRVFSSTTDLSFTAALDSVAPFIDTDGKLGFVCAFGFFADAFNLGRQDGIDMTIDLSAYVLLFEQAQERPRSARLGQRWVATKDEHDFIRELDHWLPGVGISGSGPQESRLDVALNANHITTLRLTPTSGGKRPAPKGKRQKA